MSGTTAYKGRSAALQISANGGSTFTTIGGARTANITLNNNPVDITNVGSGGFQEMLADGGTQSLSISLDGVVVNDASFKTLQTQSDDRTLIWHKLAFGAAGVIACKMAVVSLQLGAPHDGAQTFSVSLASSGTITFTPDT
jgi:predicted secreted protein